jgi:hypothetical protein
MALASASVGFNNYRGQFNFALLFGGRPVGFQSRIQPNPAFEFELSAPAIGARERQFMRAKTQRSGVSEKANAGARQRYAETKIKYTNEPLGKIQAVPDFFPSPSESAFREEGVKVTPAPGKKSIEFFKFEATKHHTPYQRMIRRLLDSCVDAHALTPRCRPTRYGMAP